MPISTFEELKTAASEWLAHDDVSARVEDLIALAEASLNRRLSLRQSQKSATGTVGSTGQITLPTDFLEIEAFTVDTGANYLAMTYMDPPSFFGAVGQSGSGYPRYYTIVGETLYVMPKPDSTTTYNYTILYLSRIPALSSTTTTNWLLTIAPDLYLFATLLQAEPYLHNDPRIPLWQMMVNNAISELQGQDMRARYRPGTGVQRPGGSGSTDGVFRRI